MKHLNVFNSVSEYNSKKDSLQKPYVTYITENKGIDMNDNVKRVAINNQDKSVDITENGSIELFADGEYSGLGKVTINTNVASSGGEVVMLGATENDVTFYDYEGTILYSYTKEEFLDLSEMPPLPSREGLICQEWNWDFDDAQAFVREYGLLDVGATYITDDGKTKLYITIATNGRMNVPLHFLQSVSNGVVVDWGDGSPTETFNNEGEVIAVHPYAEIGSYCITLDVVNGDCTIGYSKEAYDEEYDSYENHTFGVFGYRDDGRNSFYPMLKDVRLGANLNIGVNAFFESPIATINIPAYITSLGAGCIYDSNCTHLTFPRLIENIVSISESQVLRSLSLSNSITTIEQSFESSALHRIVIPDSVVEIIDCSFQNSYSLTTLVLPNSLEVIGESCFTSVAIDKLVLPNGIKEIGSYSFVNSDKTTLVSLSNSMEKLNGDTFSWISATSIVIPDNIKEFYVNQPFSYCYKLKYLDFSSYTSVPKFDVDWVDLSNYAKDIVFYLPPSIFEEWKSATNWNEFASIMQMNFAPSECISLSINGNDVIGNKTSAILEATAICNGFSITDNKYMENVVVKMFVTSEEFPQNTSETESIKRELSYTYLGVTATTEINHLPYVDYKITCKYSSNANEEVHLFNSSRANNVVVGITIDGQPAEVNSYYTFETQGEHTVIFDLDNEAKEADFSYFFNNCDNLIEADLSKVDLSISVNDDWAGVNAYLFEYCGMLKRVILPDSITEMGYEMFSGCRNLDTITIKSNKAPLCKNGNPFGSGYYAAGSNNMVNGTNKLYVPTGSTGYSGRYWDDYLFNTSHCGFTKEEIEM